MVSLFAITEYAKCDDDVLLWRLHERSLNLPLKESGSCWPESIESNGAKELRGTRAQLFSTASPALSLSPAAPTLAPALRDAKQGALFHTPIDTHNSL